MPAGHGREAYGALRHGVSALAAAVAACWLAGLLQAKGYGLLAAAAAVLHAASRLQCMRCTKLHMFLPCVSLVTIAIGADSARALDLPAPTRNPRIGSIGVAHVKYAKWRTLSTPKAELV
jgi:hypothetical protein